MGDFIAIFDQGLLIKMVTHANCTTYYKIHLKHFIFFVVNYVLFLALCEMSRFEAVSNVVKEFAVFVLLRIEEESEVVENIIKQVVNDYSSLNASR